MQLVIDVSTWTREEKNYLQSAAVSILFREGITYNGIWAKDGIINIDEPSVDVSGILTSDRLRVFIDAELEKKRIVTEEALKEAQVREQELQSNEFSDIKLADIDTKIDAIQNMTQMRVFLKKLVRFLIAGQ